MASSFQNKTKLQLEKEGWIVIKIIRAGTSGWPDLFCFRRGVAKFIESKEKKDTTKPLQKLRIDQLRAEGFDAVSLHETKGIIYP